MERILETELELISFDWKELANEMLRQRNIDPYRIKKIPHKISVPKFSLFLSVILNRKKTFCFLKKKEKKKEEKIASEKYVRNINTAGKALTILSLDIWNFMEQHRAYMKNQPKFHETILKFACDAIF